MGNEATGAGGARGRGVEELVRRGFITEGKIRLGGGSSL